MYWKRVRDYVDMWNGMTKVREQKGQGMVEYALIIAFVVVVSVALALSRPEIAQAVAGVMDYTANLFVGFGF